MNKEQLINLKRILEQGMKKYSVIYTKNGKVTNDEEITYNLNYLQELQNSQKAVQAVTDNFEKLMRFLVTNNIDYDEISIIPNFGLLINQGDFNLEEDEIKENAEVLYDQALVDFYEFSIKKNGIEIPGINLPEHLENTFGTFYYVSVKDFIIKLSEEGLELEGITKFEDIQNNSKGKITIDFSKNKNHTL